jgi:hypothetical protein
VKETSPARKIAIIKSEVATGRSMNRRDGSISCWQKSALCWLTEKHKRQTGEALSLLLFYGLISHAETLKEVWQHVRPTAEAHRAMVQGSIGEVVDWGLDRSRFAPNRETPPRLTMPVALTFVVADAAYAILTKEPPQLCCHFVSIKRS